MGAPAAGGRPQRRFRNRFQGFPEENCIGNDKETQMSQQDQIDRILSHFEEINAIPRCSKYEERVAAHLRHRAEERGFSVNQDPAGNLVIRVPASVGRETAPTVVIQGHMDMVCEKRADAKHDFSTDPIRMQEADGWLKADGTTLGADNGIALALALALAEDDRLTRPPLELLFTVDEETGLTGANRLEPGFVSGRVLLNIDSEDEGVFTVGCAGGVESRLQLPITRSPIDSDAAVFRVDAGGMKGGHSGVDIHKQRANAIHVLGRALDRASRAAEIRLVALTGGRSHNAIPRSASVQFCCPRRRRDAVKDALLSVEGEVRSEFAGSDPDLKLTIESQDAVPEAAVAGKDSLRLLQLLLALPDGVQAMSQQIEGLVETSCNLASVALGEGRLEIVTSQRSSVMSRLENITRRIEAAAALAGAAAERLNAYPAWEPNLESPLLERCKQVYRSLFGVAPHVEAIHAGLECAVIGDKYEGMNMISFGPTIRDPHSPDEALELASVEKVWAFVRALMASFVEDGG
jgi:dipeptidase D